MKRCSKCGVEKALTEFYKDNKNKKDGRRIYCKECNANERRKWRIDNAKTNNNAAKRWYYANHEKARACIDKNNKKYSKDKSKEWSRISGKRAAENINDAYVKKNLISKHGYLKEQITPVIIDIQRALIKLKRLIKNKQHGKEKSK